MTIQLPGPVTTMLDVSPLNLVVCQVSHEYTPVEDGTGARAIYETLKSDYPQFDANATQDIGILQGPTGVQALPPTATSRGWRLRSKDGAWTAVIMPEFFALETTRYSDWQDYKTRLIALGSAVEGTFTLRG